MNMRLIDGWRIHWATQENNQMEPIIDWWNEETRKSIQRDIPKTATGPLFAFQNQAAYVPFWEDVAEAFAGVEYMWTEKGKYKVTNYQDEEKKTVTVVKADVKLNVVKSSKGRWYPTHAIIPEEQNVRSMKLSSGRKIGDKVYRIDEKRKATTKQLRLTKAQQKRFTRDEFLKEIEKIEKCSNLGDYTKYWSRDALHTNLAIRYKKDPCRICEQEVGYDHFFDKCEKFKQMKKVFKEIEGGKWLAAHSTWLIHCDKPHGRLEEIQIIEKICRKNMIKKEIRNKIHKKAKKLLFVKSKK